MTLYRDELSQLRNGLTSTLEVHFRFPVGYRVKLAVSERFTARGQIKARALNEWGNCYGVRWDLGCFTWVDEEDLMPERGEK